MRSHPNTHMYPIIIPPDEHVMCQSQLNFYTVGSRVLNLLGAWLPGLGGTAWVGAPWGWGGPPGCNYHSDLPEVGLAGPSLKRRPHLEAGPACCLRLCSAPSLTPG